MDTKFIVRSGPHKGQYITLRVRVSKTNKKYAWTPYKNKSVTLTYEQARGVIRRYGGEMVSV
jgi:hypothetical protein